MSTDPTIEEVEESTPDGRAYELAILQKQRCAGFAALIEAAFENTARFDPQEMEGIARLAKDISARADECFEAVREIGREKWDIAAPRG